MSYLKKDEKPKRVEWYYIYTPQTGIDPLTVCLFTKTIPFVGLVVVFENRVALRTDLIDLSNEHHPMLLGTIIEGDYKSLHLYRVNRPDEDHIQRQNFNLYSTTPTAGRKARILWGFVRSYFSRYVRRTNRNSEKAQRHVISPLTSSA